MKNRPKRLGASIQRSVASELYTRFPGEYITVTEVEVSPDGRFAIVWVSVMDDKKEEDIFSDITKIKGKLRHAVTKTTDVRQVPQIELRLDQRHKHAQRIADITKEVRENSK